MNKNVFGIVYDPELGAYKTSNVLVEAHTEKELDTLEQLAKKEFISKICLGAVTVKFTGSVVTFKHNEGVEFTEMLNIQERVKLLNDLSEAQTLRNTTKYMLRKLKIAKGIIDRYKGAATHMLDKQVELKVLIDELEDYLK
jgi:hypothetical protein